MPTIDELQEQLDALREKDGEVYAKREDDLALARVKHEIFARTELAREHGSLGVDFAILVTQHGDLMAVKRPSSVAYQAFINAGGQQGSQFYDACYDLVNSCRIVPAKELKQEFQDLIAKCPNSIVDLADMAADLAGARSKRIEGKSPAPTKRR